MEELIVYWQILKRRWFLALAILISVGFLGYLRANQEVPLYRAKGQVLVEKESSPLGTQFPIFYQDYTNIANELALINSENATSRINR